MGVRRCITGWDGGRAKDKSSYVNRTTYSSSFFKVAQSCPTLCDPMDHTVHGILQARILEWVVSPFSRGSSQPRNWTQVPCIAGRLFSSWAAGEAQEYWSGYSIPSPVDLPNPGFEPESPALQVDSLPHTESLKDSSLCYINTTHTHWILSGSLKPVWVVLLIVHMFCNPWLYTLWCEKQQNFNFGKGLFWIREHWA